MRSSIRLPVRQLRSGTCGRLGSAHTSRRPGCGHSSEDLERVFDKFYRVQHPGHVIGTGLGLSICKGIVEAHGGHIWAQIVTAAGQ